MTLTHLKTKVLLLGVILCMAFYLAGSWKCQCYFEGEDAPSSLKKSLPGKILDLPLCVDSGMSREGWSLYRVVKLGGRFGAAPYTSGTVKVTVRIDGIFFFCIGEAVV